MTSPPTSAVGSRRNSAFDERLRASMRARQSLLCVGLDPLPERLPAKAGVGATGAARFCAAIVEATHDLVCAFKANLAFFVAFGSDGLDALAAVRAAVPAGIPVILDCKVGDVDSTAAAYARGWFDALGFDAVTVNPYLGEDSLAPFLAYPDRGVFVLCKTSNPGGGDLQDLSVHTEPGGNEPLFLNVARRTAEWQTRHPATVGLVVGATYPAQLAAVRRRCPDQPILLPGIGAQGGDLPAAVRAGIDAAGEGLLVAASRSIIYAGSGPDFAESARDAARTTRDAINDARAQADRGSGIGEDQ